MGMTIVVPAGGSNCHCFRLLRVNNTIIVDTVCTSSLHRSSHSIDSSDSVESKGLVFCAPRRLFARRAQQSKRLETLCSRPYIYGSLETSTYFSKTRVFTRQKSWIGISTNICVTPDPKRASNGGVRDRQPQHICFPRHELGKRRRGCGVSHFRQWRRGPIWVLASKTDCFFRHENEDRCRLTAYLLRGGQPSSTFQ